MMENEIRLIVIGDVKRLPASLQEDLAATIEATRNNHRMTVVLALSYSGREDILQAARALVHDIRQGRLNPERIDETTFGGYLSTAGIPDPDLLIRTSGEMRISNFFLWQTAYTEIYVTDTLWPDFREPQFLEALEEYQQRERRFGRVTERADRERLRAAR